MTGASKEQIEQLYHERYLPFRRALAMITGSFDVAHDVVQEAFARALRQRHTFRNEGPLGAWVWQIALRVALDARPEAEELPFDELMADVELVEPSRDGDLSDALRTLPARRRLVFFLRYFADLSYREIAAVCDISEGTVAASLAQARAMVVEALEEVMCE